MSIDDIMRELSNLLNQMDISDLEDLEGFDVETHTDARSIRSGPTGSRKGSPKRRKSSRHDKSDGMDNKDKHELGRKIQRFNRLSKKLERRGKDFTDLIDDGETETQDPLIRWYDTDDGGKKAVIDEPEVTVECDPVADGESTLVRITLPECDTEQTHEIDLSDPTVEKQTNGTVTTVTFTTG